MLNPKFDYQPLSRTTEDGKRFYQTPGGHLPSVTTVLEKTKTEEKKQALQEWRRRVGAAQAQAITTEAASRGTRMHTYLEHYVKTGELKDRGSNPFSWASHAMAQTIIDHGLVQCQEFWGTEVGMYFPKIYAGTTDLVGVHKNVECIMDHKQTNKPKKREWIDDYFLQLAAYAAAHNEVYGTQINKGVVFMCVAPKEIEPGIFEKPQYQEFVLEGAEFASYTQQWWKRVEEYYIKHG
jgi:hypothetical protein